MQISPFKIERYFARFEFNVDYVLCGSDCESMTVEELLSFEPDAADRFHQLWLGCTESQGYRCEHPPQSHRIPHAPRRIPENQPDRQ